MGRIVVGTPMVFGRPITSLKKNEIQVTLEKTSFSQGDTIKGRVELKLHKETQARKASVSLIAKKISQVPNHSYNTGFGHSRLRFRHRNIHTNTEIFNIYTLEVPLGGEQTYFQEAYPFEIKIPLNALESAERARKPGGEGIIGELANTADELRTISSKVEWYVEARLNIPLKIDVCGSQKIALS